MCGIVGVITKGKYGPLKPEEEAFYDMLMVDVVRGDDATGAILIERDKDFTIFKDQWQPWWVIPEIRDHAHGKRMFSSGAAFIGHNRKATVGKLNSNTAHPFVVDNVFAMVHNGTLRNHKQLADTEVDSEALAKHLKPVLGPDYTKEAFEEAIGKVEGAYAVAAYNQETHKIYLFRNAERPLCIIETKDAFFFGSEFGMVNWCAHRNNNQMKDANSEYLDVDTLYTIDLETRTMTKEAFTPKKPIPATRVMTSGGNNKVITNTASNYKSKGDGAELSKAELKRIRRQFLGKSIKFYTDDYVEKNFPKTRKDGETEVLLMGVSDELSCSHFVSGLFDTKFMKEDESWLDRLFMGRVSDITYNRITGNLTFYVENVSIYPMSVPNRKGKNNEASVTVH